MNLLMPHEPNESDPNENRYLTEGICPGCHKPMERVLQYVAVCKACDLKWSSSRVAKIFPKAL